MEEVVEEELFERYSRMSRHQKLALLMIALEPEASATLLKRFNAKIQNLYVKKLEIFLLLTKN